MLMASTTWFLREFIRKVFRDAKASAKSVEAMLDDLSDAAIEASNEDSGSGKITTGITTPEGNSLSWQALPQAGGYLKQIELIDTVRTLTSAATNTDDATRDAILLKIKTIRRYGVSFKEGEVR